MHKTEHPFAQYIRILGKGKNGSRSLSEQEAFDAFSMIINQQAQDLQIGAFLMLLRVKEESIDELLGFTKAIKYHFEQNQTQINTINIDLDWASYAGKRKHYPWYILAALTLAKNGYRIFMHGSQGHTEGRLYSEQVLAFLGYPICKTTQQIFSELENTHFAYAPLELLLPQLDKLLHLKSILGLRSPINTVVRLFNPFNAPATLQSIFHPAYRSSHQQVAYRLGYKNNAVIKGEGGEFERNPDAKTLIYGINQNTLYEHTLPKLTADRTPIESHFDLHFFKDVWLGKQSHPYGENAVIETMQIALYTMNIADSYDKALQLAKQLWNERINNI